MDTTGPVRVVDGLLSSRVEWPDTDISSVETDGQWRLKLRRFDLWSTDASIEIGKLRRIDDLVQGLVRLSTSSSDRLLPITGGFAADYIPWEALDARFLSASMSYHPVRADESIRIVPRDDDSPLRVAILIGHEGPDRPYDRHIELAKLVTACSASAQVNARLGNGSQIATFDLAERATASDRRSFFASVKPQLVIYFGHGRIRGKPSIRIGPNRSDWLDLDELAQDAVGPSPYPASWVFLACSIGQSPTRDTGPAGPDAFRILASRGAQAMLAMRARIRPYMAHIVAASLIESISAGVPLEFAASSARRVARRSGRNTNPGLLDWAAPAVWSTVVGPRPLKGSDVATEFVAAKLTRTSAGDPSLGLEVSASDYVDTARHWVEQRHVRLDAEDEDDVALAAKLGSVAGAIASISGRPTLYIRTVGSAAFVHRLAQWAESALRALSSFERESALGRSLRKLAGRDLEGLEQVLAVPGIVVIADSIPSSTDSVSWRLFEDAPSSTTVILTYRSSELPHRAGWTVDAIGTEDGMEVLAELARQIPKSLALLFVLESPLNLARLQAITGEASEGLISRPLAVAMPGGIVLSSLARQALRDHLTDEQIGEAHRMALGARYATPPLIESDEQFADVRHLAAFNQEQTVEYVNRYAQRDGASWTPSQWLELARALSSARDIRNALDPRINLQIAAASLEQQSLPEARRWLNAIATTDDVFNGRRLGMLSEIEKAVGSAAAQKRMWSNAREAVTLLTRVWTANQANKQVQLYLGQARANLARLELYFNHNAAGAADILRITIAEFGREDDKDAAELLAATLRNLSECYFEFEPFRTQQHYLDEARNNLVRAAALARRHKLAALEAEILYSTAKLDDVVGDRVASREHLEAAAESARNAGHAVCYAISDLRLFWHAHRYEGQPFDYALFMVKLGRLELRQSHAWARRYAQQSRIWAAHALQDAGEITLAIEVLAEIIHGTEEPEGLASERDRTMLAIGYSGLSTLGPSQGSNDGPEWKKFNELSWARDWLIARNVESPSALWRGSH